jgi:cell division protease FtsH
VSVEESGSPSNTPQGGERGWRLPDKDSPGPGGRWRRAISAGLLASSAWYVSYALRSPSEDRDTAALTVASLPAVPKEESKVISRNELIVKLITTTEVEKVAYTFVESGLVSYEFPLVSQTEAPKNLHQFVRVQWFQPGADHDSFVQLLRENGVEIRPVGEREREFRQRYEERSAERELELSKNATILASHRTLERLLALGISIGLIVYCLREVRKKVMATSGIGGALGIDLNAGSEMKERPVEGFSHIGGMSSVIEELSFLRDEINAAQNGDKEFEIPKGILFYGPPGTGKTMLARALAGETNCPYVSFKGSDLSTEFFVGSGIAKVRNAFIQARKLRDEHKKELQAAGNNDARGVCIVFIDEFDSIASRRQIAGGNSSSEETKVVNMLLTELDNIHKGDNHSSGNHDILVLAATNDVEKLDPAVIRSGRFNRRIEVPAPQSKSARRDVLEKAFRFGFEPKGWQLVEKERCLDRLAQLTVGSSGADLVGVFEKAASISRRRDGSKMMTFDDIMEGFQQQHFGFKITDMVSPQEKEKTAVHELVGHGVIAWACEIAVFLISMEPRGKSLGRVIPDPEAMSEVTPTKQQLLKRVLVSVAGQVAEKHMYGELEATIGNTSDLDHIRKMLKMLISTRLLGDDVAVSLLDSYGHQEPRLSEKREQLINETISRASQTVEAILDLLPKEEWEKFVQHVLTLNKELVGDEAQSELSAWFSQFPEIKEKARSLVSAFLLGAPIIPPSENKTEDSM